MQITIMYSQAPLPFINSSTSNYYKEGDSQTSLPTSPKILSRMNANTSSIRIYKHVVCQNSKTFILTGIHNKINRIDSFYFITYAHFLRITHHKNTYYSLNPFRIPSGCNRTAPFATLFNQIDSSFLFKRHPLSFSTFDPNAL